MKARIDFKNDPSVGMFSESYEMEIPFNEETIHDYGVDDLRQDIAAFYNKLHGDSFCNVYFDFE